MLGYIQSPEDKRDIIYKIPISVAESYELNNVDRVVNQGQDPICAAISLSTMINWQLGARKKGFDIPYRSVYELRDKGMEGMVPRNALKVLKKEGVSGYKIKSYSKVVDAESAKAAILMNGPLMVCFMAYEGDRFWVPGGKELGGHAVVLTGWDKRGFVLQNSWGTEWGAGGKMTMPDSDWKYVLESWTINI